MTQQQTKDFILRYITATEKLVEQGFPVTTLCVEGVAGLGKTSVIKQVADDAGYQFIKRNLGEAEDLGALFGYKQIPRDSDPTTGKTKFNIEDELKLSEWMSDNLIMYFLPTSDFNNIEIELINHFNPPLNLKDNSNIINFDFRRLLSSLRAKKK